MKLYKEMIGLIKKFSVLIALVIGLVGCSGESMNKMNEKSKDIDNQYDEYVQMIVSTTGDMSQALNDFENMEQDDQLSDRWMNEAEEIMNRLQESSQEVIAYDRSEVPKLMKPVHDKYLDSSREYYFVASNFVKYLEDKDVAGLKQIGESMNNGKNHLEDAMNEMDELREELGIK